MTSCETQISDYAGHCTEEIATYWSCQITTATYVCATDTGVRMEKGCVDELVSWKACAACIPLPEDDEAATCIKQACCGEWKAMIGDHGYKEMLQCMEGCDTFACANACLNSIYRLNDALAACEGTNCA